VTSAGQELTPQLLASVDRRGWILARADLKHVRIVAAELGWNEGPIRRGDDVVSRLEGRDHSDAHPRSLSATYGLGAQPLHTDGAHLERPPDVIALAAISTSMTATRLFETSGAHDLPTDALRHGVFKVTSGGDCHLTTAATPTGYRFDPACMSPCDSRARQVTAYFAVAFDQAHRHSWVGNESVVLVVDNRAVLHAREAIEEEDRDRVLERVAFWLPEHQ